MFCCNEWFSFSCYISETRAPAAVKCVDFAMDLSYLSQLYSSWNFVFVNYFNVYYSIRFNINIITFCYLNIIHFVLVFLWFKLNIRLCVYMFILQCCNLDDTNIILCVLFNIHLIRFLTHIHDLLSILSCCCALFSITVFKILSLICFTIYLFNKLPIFPHIMILFNINFSNPCAL